MKTSDLLNHLNLRDYCSIHDFCCFTNFKFDEPPIESRYLGDVIIDKYEVKCDDGIAIVMGARTAGPEWTNITVGYVTAYIK